jgi:hypothetical protein
MAEVPTPCYLERQLWMPVPCEQQIGYIRYLRVKNEGLILGSHLRLVILVFDRAENEKGRR